MSFVELSDAKDVSDTDLMRRVQAGDEAALGELMRRWEIPLKAVIARLVLNTEEAADLAQETFVRVWHQRHAFRAGAAFKPWILSIGLNLARNRLRWWRRRPTLSLDAWSETPGAANLVANTESSGAEAAELRERADAVRDAIAALPPPLREAIILSEYERLSHAEIAAIVSATPKAIETRLHRARAKLREKLRNLTAANAENA